MAPPVRVGALLLHAGFHKARELTKLEDYNNSQEASTCGTPLPESSGTN